MQGRIASPSRIGISALSQQKTSQKFMPTYRSQNQGAIAISGRITKSSPCLKQGSSSFDVAMSGSKQQRCKATGIEVSRSLRTCGTGLSRTAQLLNSCSACIH
tara:strand:- start:181 stop:489 length:309 start_codon:yes stop_codon:yes gene_type:complete